MKLKFFVRHGYNSTMNLVTFSPPSHIRFMSPFVKEHDMREGELLFLATDEDEGTRPQYLYIARMATAAVTGIPLPCEEAGYKLIVRKNSTTYITAKQVMTALGITKTKRLPIEVFNDNGFSGFRVTLWEKEQVKVPSIKSIGQVINERKQAQQQQ